MVRYVVKTIFSMVESLLFIGAETGAGVGAGASEKIPRAGASQKWTGSTTLLATLISCGQATPSLPTK